MAPLPGHPLGALGVLLALALALALELQDLAALAGRQRQGEHVIWLLGAAEAFCERLGARRHGRGV